MKVGLPRIGAFDGNIAVGTYCSVLVFLKIRIYSVKNIVVN